MSTPEPVDWASAYRYLEQELEAVLTRVAQRMEQLQAGGAVPGVRIRSVSLVRRDSGSSRASSPPTGPG